MENNMPNWFNPEDPDQAYAEGWCIAECQGSHYFPDGWYDLQRWDEAGVFKLDIYAVAFVTDKAASHSEYHSSALMYMEQQNMKLLNAARAEAELRKKIG
jgi:hypothetical protein